MSGWFITGTDTGVGKTRVAAALLAALARSGIPAAGMKPVASGCRETAQGLRNEDAERLAMAGAVRAAYALINPYALPEPVAPHLAARAAGVEIRLDVIRAAFEQMAARAPWVVVEGAGGWLTPINRDQTMADVAKALGLPVILVVGLRLGCLNHALLTAAAIRRCGLALAGWVANRLDPGMQRLEENIETLSERLEVPWFTALPYAPQGFEMPAEKVQNLIEITEES